jgi:anti-anti-sigma factor
MEIKKDIAGNTMKYKVIGEMSVDEARAFTDEVMDNIAKKNPKIEIDLSECDFMCSNGIGALAAALMVTRSRGGDLTLTAVSHNVKKLLDITALGTIIKIKQK